MKEVGRKPKIVAVDLFCGVGGLTCGLTKGGISVAAGVDVDPSCRYPYEENNSAIFIEKDVEQLQPQEVESFLSGGDYTLLAGCAPCQPFSTYSRAGRGKRHESQWPLLRSFGRLVQKVNPHFVTMENVPQLIEHNVFKEFLGCLHGYEIWWDVVECTSIGVPQTRKRLVLIASRLGRGKLSIQVGGSDLKTVRNAIGNLPEINAGASHPDDPLHMSPSLSALNMQRIRLSRPGGSWRDWPTELQANCHRKTSGATYPSVYGRMEWDKPSPTITTQCFGYGNGRFGHPVQDRAISLREAALLQTFPKDYKFSPKGKRIKFNQMGRLIGNAVPVRLGEVIADAIFSHIGQSDEKQVPNPICAGRNS